ncbi:helix-turn-helix domain-containing protein [Nocardia fluminea]|uniref:helix-turn-helix domain-containing protein n=1 Tax=Nocardia fluminea TaxID=134984 RepID=UPI0036532A3A
MGIMIATMDTPAPQAGRSNVMRARKAVAAQLRSERARIDISQADLAKSAGLGTNTIRRIENEERAITLDQLVAICDVLGVSFTRFLDDAQAHMRE